MGLKSVLVDQCVIVRRGATGPKVAGQTPMGDVLSVPFKGRVDDPSPQELRRDQIQFIEYTRSATLMTSIKDTANVLLDIKASDKVRVLTGPYAGDYEVMGQPEPIRKKRKMIGWEIRLREPRGREG